MRRARHAGLRGGGVPRGGGGAFVLRHGGDGRARRRDRRARRPERQTPHSAGCAHRPDRPGRHEYRRKRLSARDKRRRRRLPHDARQPGDRVRQRNADRHRLHAAPAPCKGRRRKHPAGFPSRPSTSASAARRRKSSSPSATARCSRTRCASCSAAASPVRRWTTAPAALASSAPRSSCGTSSPTAACSCSAPRARRSAVRARGSAPTRSSRPRPSRSTFRSRRSPARPNCRASSAAGR